MAKPNSNSDRDEGVRGHLLTHLDTLEELQQVMKLEKQPIDTSGNPAAQSQWSTGRACPKCKNALRIKELNADSGLMTVFCSKCGTEYHAPDLESTTAIGDKIHRQIPDTLVNAYMAARQAEMKKRGQ